MVSGAIIIIIINKLSEQLSVVEVDSLLLYASIQAQLRNRYPRHLADITVQLLVDHSDLRHTSVLRPHSDYPIFSRTSAPLCQHLPPLQRPPRQLAAVTGHRSSDFPSCPLRCRRPLPCNIIFNGSRHRHIFLNPFFIRPFPVFSNLLTVHRLHCPFPATVVYQAVIIDCTCRQSIPHGLHRCQHQICN